MEAQPHVACVAGGRGRAERLAGRVLDERVATRQRALGVVSAECQRQAFELTAAPGGLGSLSALRCPAYHQQVPVGQRLTAVAGAACARPQLAHELVQVAAVARDVLHGRAR